MRYLSTRGQSPPISLRHALFEGLAPDGGLYLPEEVPALDPSFLTDLAGRSLQDCAAAVLGPYLAEIPAAERRRILAEALDFPIPLTELPGDGDTPPVRVLELFHGPTLAFKDVGARFMARLFSWYRGDEANPLTVLVATSGDTGGAVAQAFHRVAATRVAVLYPRGKVSPLQERQFTTLGGNIRALAVDGTFDDCQRLVKAAFSDTALRRRLALTSANSINIGRLLPQAVYYVHAAAQLPAGAPPPLFATPSGNFGNLTAGLLARRMGLPCAGFVAATNVNDVVPTYLETGEFNPRPSTATLSNAMDVGNPSNFDRILHLCGGQTEAVRRELVAGSRWTDEQTGDALVAVYRRTGVLLDPHTAVGYLGLGRALRQLGEEVSGIVLATAHPAKFRDQVEPLLGETLTLPPRLAAHLERPPQATPLAPEPAALSRFLDSWKV